MRRLPPGINWLEAIYKPKKVARLRRKQLEASGPGFTKKQFAALVKKYDGRCVRCGKNDKHLVPDHIEPLSKGGDHDIRNIQPLCDGCNFAKGITTSPERR